MHTITCHKFFELDLSTLLIWGEPERAPNTQETGSGVYIFIYLYIYLFVRDLAWQPTNAHAQLPHVATYVTSKGRQRRHSGPGLA